MGGTRFKGVLSIPCAGNMEESLKWQVKKELIFFSVSFRYLFVQRKFIGQCFTPCSKEKLLQNLLFEIENKFSYWDMDERNGFRSGVAPGEHLVSETGMTCFSHTK